MVSTQTRHPLACSAVIAAQLLLLGCGARRDEGLWSWPRSATPVATAATAEVHSPIDFDPVTKADKVTDTNPFETSLAATPSDVLESAGGIIEQDAQGQPAGVNLSGAEISTELMRAVGELGEIQWLDLRGARLSDDHLSVLTQLPHLQLLALGDTPITDEGLQSIKSLNELRFLSLDRTQVSDTGLQYLTGLQNLEGISLQGTRVSQVGAQSFKSRVPGCSVILDRDAPAEPPVNAPVESPDPLQPFPGEPTSKTHQRSRQSDQREYSRTAPMSQRPVAGVSDVQQTRRALATLLQQKLLDPEILEAFGQHLLAQGKFHPAARAFEVVLNHEPDNLQAHFGLAIARARMGEFDTALPHFVTVVGEATAFFNLGVIAYELQQRQPSERFFQEALRREPNFADARHWLAHIRHERSVTPASHAPQPTDERGLVNLLMSEFGRVDSGSTGHSGESGIQIVPVVKSGSPADGR